MTGPVFTAQYSSWRSLLPLLTCYRQTPFYKSGVFLSARAVDSYGGKEIREPC